MGKLHKLRRAVLRDPSQFVGHGAHYVRAKPAGPDEKLYRAWTRKPGKWQRKNAKWRVDYRGNGYKRFVRKTLRGVAVAKNNRLWVINAS